MTTESEAHLQALEALIALMDDPAKRGSVVFC